MSRSVVGKSRGARRLGLAIGVGSALLVGCDGSGPMGDSGVVADSLDAHVETTIGATEGPPEAIFGRIVGVAADRDGVIYVADEQGSTVRAYDAADGYLGTVGSEGDGPGEFRYLLGLDIDPAGRLVVRGAFRVSVFERSSAGAFADSVVRTFPVPGGNPDREIRGRAGEAHYFAPTFHWEGFRPRGYYYVAYDSAGAVADTIPVPPFPDPETTGTANYQVSAQGGRNVPGINRSPFEPRPRWDIDDQGRVWFTAGDRYEIVHVAPTGDTLAILRRPDEVRAVPQDERRDSLAAFRMRLDSVPVPLGEVRGMSDLARRGDVPEVLPAILAIQVGEDGRVWVRRWPREGRRETVFDVLDPSGAGPDRVVVIPGALSTTPAPWIAGGLVLGVLEDPVAGVQRVGVFRLEGT